MERAQALAQALRDTNDDHNVATLFYTFDNLDKERNRYMIATENYAARPKPTGIYEWSPRLERSGHTVTYWNLHLNHRNGKCSPPLRMAEMRI